MRMGVSEEAQKVSRIIWMAHWRALRLHSWLWHILYRRTPKIRKLNETAEIIFLRHVLSELLIVRGSLIALKFLVFTIQNIFKRYSLYLYQKVWISSSLQLLYLRIEKPVSTWKKHPHVLYHLITNLSC